MCLSREKVMVCVIYSIFLTAVQVCSVEILHKTICKAQFTTQDQCVKALPTTEQSMCDTTEEIFDKNNAIEIIPSSAASTGDLTTFEFCERDVQSLTVKYVINRNGNVSFYTWNKNATITDAKDGKKSKTEDAAPHEPSLLKSDNVYEINNDTYIAQHSRSRPVINLTVNNITSENMTLIWTVAKKKSWVKRIFNITVNKNYTYLENEEKCCYNGTNNCYYTIVNLTAFTQYVVTVNVIESPDIYLNGSYESNSTSSDMSCWKTTEEKPPQKLENCNVEYLENKPSEALLRWSLPEASYNSRCVTFNIKVTGHSGNWQNLSIESRDNYFSTNITDVVPGNIYSFRVYANNTYDGVQCVTRVTMPKYKPPQNFMKKINIYIETTSVTVEICQTEDTHKNGRIQSYKIIVSKLPNTHDVPETIPSWDEVQTDKSWSRYSIMISPEIFKNTENWNFTIGNGTCYDKRDDPCNGPLEPDTKYYIFIRAYTDSAKFTDTPWLITFQTKQDNTLLLAILGMVCALAVSVWVALLWWCGAFRCLLENKTGISHNMQSRPPLTTHPVQLEHFPKYVRTMLNDTPNMFTEEFRGLSQVGREQPCTAANLPCNKHKNRFTNILPYDHSRFKLQPVDDEEGSDYINANYVPGFHSQKDFIATQGPMMHTRNSFWRMCWESNACAIVMLTRCVEKSMEKCDHYWPYDNQPTSYGNLYIATLSSKHHCNWTISELFISKGGEKRHIYHLQFIAWPDFGVPNPPSTLVQFVRVFREHCQPGRGGPVIVHCSAGVGRSGTFIALDRLMLQLHSRAEYLDVVGLVYSMRRARPLMVQTERQYVCIHACIASVLEAVDIWRRRSTVITRPCAAAPPPPPQPRHLSQQVHYNLAFEDDEDVLIIPESPPVPIDTLKKMFS